LLSLLSSRIINDISHIKQTVLDLISKEKRKIVFEILDFYFSKAKTLKEFDILGELSLKAEYHELYLICAEAAYSHAKNTEQIIASRTNLYQAYNRLNYPEKALFYIDLHYKNNAQSFDCKLNTASNLALLGNREQADEILQNLSCETKEQFENVKFCLSAKMLREGDTSNGILNFINAFKPPSKLFQDQLKMTKWTGSPQPGRTIYINAEGGIGDEIINIRFLNKIKHLGMRPILYSSWSMYRLDIVDLFKRNNFEVISETYSIDTKELWTNMMELPGYLCLEEKDLWDGPYLTPKRNPKNKLESKKFKIGIKANGNPYFSQDIYRRIPIDEIIEMLSEFKDIEIYFFDKERSHPKCINMKDRLNSWDDTLDYVDQMDVIVSSCTSLVHAAGAIGKTTIVMTPIAEYYVWTSTRTNGSTPWYGDNFHVAKQEKLRSWVEPLAKAKEIIKTLIK
jgi:hypothetical protein